MKRKVLFSFVLAGLAVASTKSFTLNLLEPAMLGGTEFKPGDYKLEVVDQKAIIHDDKTRAEAPVKVETVDAKYGATTVRFTNGDGKLHIQEIHIGGTKTKLIVNE